MSHTGKPETRIERLLSVAVHPGTPVPEAATAVEGARKIAIRHDLMKHYGLRIAGAAMAVANRRTVETMGRMKPSMVRAILEFEKINKLME